MLRCVASRGWGLLPSCAEGRLVLIPAPLSLRAACWNNWEEAQWLPAGLGEACGSPRRKSLACTIEHTVSLSHVGVR